MVQQKIRGKSGKIRKNPKKSGKSGNMPKKSGENSGKKVRPDQKLNFSKC
jgi:hypothetical protein